MSDYNTSKGQDEEEEEEEDYLSDAFLQKLTDPPKEPLSYSQRRQRQLVANQEASRANRTVSVKEQGMSLPL